jgi:hypothetical protein
VRVHGTGKSDPTRQASISVRLGAAWANRDGKGLTLVFDSYPVVGRIQVREFSEQQPEENGGR